MGLLGLCAGSERFASLGGLEGSTSLRALAKIEYGAPVCAAVWKRCWPQVLRPIFLTADDSEEAAADRSANYVHFLKGSGHDAVGLHLDNAVGTRARPLLLYRTLSANQKPPFQRRGDASPSAPTIPHSVSQSEAFIPSRRAPS